MALQGTIDAFPLTDVLQLLSSSSKSGRLLLEGDRGRAELWIEAGAVVGGAANGSTTGAALLVFEMLRFADGSFVFDAVEGAPPVEVTPAELAECVPAAAELLEEWVRIEAVVPSMAHGIMIAPELTDDAVTVGADEWRIVAAAGDVPSVGDLAARLGLDEFSTCAALADLVGRALLVVTEPRMPVTGSAPEMAPETPFTVEDDRGALDASPAPEVAEPAEEESFPERFPIDDLLGGGEESDGPWATQEDEGHRFAAAQSFEPLGADAFGEPVIDEHLPERTAEAWDEVVSGQSAVEEPWQELPMDAADQQAADETADEVLRQMSRLSPKAAEAIAAALNGPTSTTPVSHDSGGEHRDNDGPVSFMGSF